MNESKIFAHEQVPGTVFPPGALIAEELKARGIKQVELARVMELSKSEMNMIIHGKRNITVSHSLKLEKFFGIPAELWMNYQKGYEISLMRKKSNPVHL